MTDDARKKIVTKLLSAAKAGDWDAVKIILDRMEGKPKQAHEVSGPDGQSIVVKWATDAHA